MMNDLQQALERLLTEAKKDDYEPLVHDEAPEIMMRKARDVVATIKKRCGPFLKQWGGRPMYRGLAGMKNKGVWLAVRKSVRDDRKPKDSSRDQHQKMVNYLNQFGFSANRHNSIFCTGSADAASYYGSLSVVFPEGSFDFTWSPKVSDAADDFEDDFNGDPRIAAIANQLEGDRRSIPSWARREEAKYYLPQMRLRPAQKKILTKLLANKEFHAGFVSLMKSIKIPTSFKGLISNRHLTSLAASEIAFQLADGKNKWTDLINTALGPSKGALVDRFKYTDKDLAKAIRSGNEIMVAADSAIYVRHAFYKHYIGPLLAGKKLNAQSVYKSYHEDDDDE